MLWTRVEAESFHARFDALWRRYVYVFSDAPYVPVILRGQVAWATAPLDSHAMHAACRCLVGEHDFSAFRAAGCQSRSPWRRVAAINVTRANDYVAIDVTANAFLKHMVRNIAGALREVGNGSLTADAFAALFEGRDRTRCPPTAQPQGLYLVGAGYPQWETEVRLPPML